MCCEHKFRSTAVNTFRYVYRPHSDTIENFRIHLESMLGSSVVSRDTFIIKTGDINVNLGGSSPSVIYYVVCILIEFDVFFFM